MEALWLYALLVAGIIAVPGMDMAFVLSSALVGGRRAGFAAVAGLMAGGVAHAALATVGVGLVLQQFPAASTALLTAGALYVGWIGWQLWRTPAVLSATPGDTARSWRATFLRALATCLLNPKAYLFTFAVFPQFLGPGDVPLALRALALGAITAAVQCVIYGSVAAGADWSRRGWLRSPASQQAIGRAVGLLLMAMAASTLWQAWSGA
ncbi:MAG TPA: LysE family translocator [Ramlibacter sp.]|jgi:threonine/homoserine/homoserine lactone efflux protein|uniref:LysE family translocator n=1 Tax=Ramlibacter sp. TaxID=1917967 RepID=UPI002D713BEE|nr:LysE family translocator [Ramlibacter sp.]HZY17283.1 LysE family translocator [Ramlibacter sp.]